jgi:hypothetical protein
MANGLIRRTMKVAWTRIISPILQVESEDQRLCESRSLKFMKHTESSFSL